jgi:hypothetical protein
VEVDELVRLHAVDVVGAQHHDVVRHFIVDDVQVLVDRVGRACKPPRTFAHLRRHRGDIVPEQT